MLKRGHKGTCQRRSWKRPNRYIGHFTGRHNMRELDTLEQVARSCWP